MQRTGGFRRITPAGAALVVATTMTIGCSGHSNKAAPVTNAKAAPAGTAAPLADPSVRGAHPVGYLELSVTDPSRHRTLPVSVWYPAASRGTQPARYAIVGKFTMPAKDVWTSVPVARGPHPLIIFSHGNGGSRFQSWSITETLASHGFIVAAPDHVGNTINDPNTVASIAKSGSDRPKDVPLVIDELLRRTSDANDALHGAIDPNRIGMTGHSYGGYTTLAAAGGSGFGDPPEKRLKAIAPMAPSASLVPEDKLQAVTIPTLLMGGTLDTEAPPPREIVHTYGLINSAIKYRVVIANANHYAFTMVCAAGDVLSDPSVPLGLANLAKDYETANCGPEVMPFDQSSRIINRYLVAFFLWQLAGDQHYQQFMTPVAGVTFVGTSVPQSSD